MAIGGTEARANSFHRPGKQPNAKIPKAVAMPMIRPTRIDAVT